jgi:hypothetical protein
MEKIDSAKILENAKGYKRWILFYDFKWAPSGANRAAFAFWVHRKQIYLGKKFIPLPIYESTEGDCPDLDRWIQSYMHESGKNLVGDGWGSIILCSNNQFLASAPMLIETGIIHFNKLLQTVYESQT